MFETFTAALAAAWGWLRQPQHMAAVVQIVTGVAGVAGSHDLAGIAHELAVLEPDVAAASTWYVGLGLVLSGILTPFATRVPAIGAVLAILSRFRPRRTEAGQDRQHLSLIHI